MAERRAALEAWAEIVTAAAEGHTADRGVYQRELGLAKHRSGLPLLAGNT